MDLGKKIVNAILPGIFDEKLHMNQLKTARRECIAIDQHGCLGSFYDAHTDTITGKLKPHEMPEFDSNNNRTRYEYIEDVKCHAPNLLQFVGIDHQLRLSILLQMTKTNGIASLIKHPPSIDKQTRLFYVYHELHTSSYGKNIHQLQKIIRKTNGNTYATHVVTELVCGIHILAILQLPSEQEEKINALLSPLCRSLNNYQYPNNLNAKEKVLLNQIISIKVYSNMNELTTMKKFEDIYERIIQMRTNKNRSQLLKYILTPLACFYDYNLPIREFFTCQPHETEHLEHYLLQQSAELKRLKLVVNDNLPELLQGDLQNQLESLQNEVLILDVQEKNDTQQIRDLIVEMRQGKHSCSIFNNKKCLDAPKQIQQLIQKINMRSEELKRRGKLLKRLQNDGCEYCDVSELGIQNGSKEDRVKDLLLGNDSSKIMFFSNDTFFVEYPENWMIIYSQMIEECRNNPPLQLVYADFTYSTYHLSKMEIVRVTTPSTNDSLLNAKPSLNTIKRRATLVSRSATNEYINIVLLGESGVGKSTFINALANYLLFSSLDEAEQGEPTVIIPVSYVMTINDDFEERIVKFGDIDVNENHNDFGQSVTQQCKSYVFDINEKRKLRIIDTPGFGDTRGNEQDDLNMEMIFSFLSNFTYVNGICLLFKSEVVQLNPYFRLCCTQLFEYFGENIRDHFIFCFTNARATFFTPGNIRPLLNGFFDSFPVKKIPFLKENSFSFDSESFRYLVAIRNDIKFADDQRGEFQQSWQRSVIESRRFGDLLCRQKSYEKTAQWRSMKEAQFQIHQTIRPMLEAARNLLRNIILHPNNSSIQLFATPAELSSILCYSDDHRTPTKFGDIWIRADHLHRLENRVSSDR